MILALDGAYHSGKLMIFCLFGLRLRLSAALASRDHPKKLEAFSLHLDWRHLSPVQYRASVLRRTHQDGLIIKALNALTKKKHQLQRTMNPTIKPKPQTLNPTLPT